ncbi:hypothetical protein CH75_09110 [Dyella jiangningensis]|nr:hypothetical protein CH75_09110 [Dyella jiangningensis]
MTSRRISVKRWAMVACLLLVALAATPAHAAAFRTGAEAYSACVNQIPALEKQWGKSGFSYRCESAAPYPGEAGAFKLIQHRPEGTDDELSHLGYYNATTCVAPQVLDPATQTCVSPDLCKSSAIFSGWLDFSGNAPTIMCKEGCAYMFGSGTSGAKVDGGSEQRYTGSFEPLGRKCSAGESSSGLGEPGIGEPPGDANDKPSDDSKPADGDDKPSDDSNKPDQGDGDKPGEGGDKSGEGGDKPGDGTDASKGEGDGKNDGKGDDKGTASGGTDCTSPPSCAGDAPTCMVVQQTWALRCNQPEWTKVKDSDGDQYKTPTVNRSDVFKTETIDPSALNQSSWAGNTCPDLGTAQIFGTSWSPDSTLFCRWLQYIRAVVLLAGAVCSCLILAGGVKD